MHDRQRSTLQREPFEDNDRMPLANLRLRINARYHASTPPPYNCCYQFYCLALTALADVRTSRLISISLLHASKPTITIQKLECLFRVELRRLGNCAFDFVDPPERCSATYGWSINHEMRIPLCLLRRPGALAASPAGCHPGIR